MCNNTCWLTGILSNIIICSTSDIGLSTLGLSPKAPIALNMASSSSRPDLHFINVDIYHHGIILGENCFFPPVADTISLIRPNFLILEMKLLAIG